MPRQCLPALCKYAVAMPSVLVISVPAASQTTAPGQSSATRKWVAPRTVDRQPDLQGVWDFGTLTPLERPAALGG